MSVCINCNIYWHACSFFLITNYDVRFIVRNNSVGSYCWFHNTVTLRSWPVYTNFCTLPYNCLLYNFPSISLHMLQCCSAHTIMSLYVLFFCQYCTCRYDAFHCLIKLFIFCICCLFLFVIFLSNDIWFEIPDLVLLLLHFQSLLSDLPSTPISKCLLHQ